MGYRGGAPTIIQFVLSIDLSSLMTLSSRVEDSAVDAQTIAL